MASQIIAEITRSDLADLPSRNGKITGFRHLASYNWLEKPVSTIRVPGCPPLWAPPSVPPKLTADTGMVYIDQNAARNPRFPLEPLFRALYVEERDFQIGDIDLVTDRSNIRKLLRFVQGSSNDAFQIQVETAGSKTALFTRVEARPTDIIQGFRGYGHSFEKAYTKKQSGSTAHHRIVGYDFGGINCIVRHETDGYVDNRSPTGLTDNLSDALKGLSISELDNYANDSAATLVETGGKAVDPSSTLEIKTRAASRTVKQNGGRNAIVTYDGGTKLRIVEAGEKRALPDDLYAKWEVKEPWGGALFTAQVGRADAAKLKNKEDESSSGQPTAPLLIPNNTPFSDIINHASLPIDVLAGRKLRDIMRDMRSGKSDWDPEERREIQGLKSLARDSAFRLLYLFLLDEFASEVKDQNSAYNVAFFVVSHRRIFQYRTRKMVREAFEARFRVSDKQRKNLDKWPIGSQEGEDVTTEEEGFDFDSDSDFDFD
ncbi:Isoprenoid biosynthetic process [Coniochaeta hoffmannii]|uniref:Isoprenoid biosynthetic process n=1 Tax=Coniochaeta hoffmannii TaxID=91930 RepID=A0AA38S500_9PEZI|nr:Isoprenoid biosynthetic process [Coniochaeta hoffmannii]